MSITILIDLNFIYLILRLAGIKDMASSSSSSLLPAPCWTTQVPDSSLKSFSEIVEQRKNRAKIRMGNYSTKQVVWYSEGVVKGGFAASGPQDSVRVIIEPHESRKNWQGEVTGAWHLSSWLRTVTDSGEEPDQAAEELIFSINSTIQEEGQDVKFNIQGETLRDTQGLTGITMTFASVSEAQSAAERLNA